jgi:hypothetical protein
LRNSSRVEIEEIEAEKVSHSTPSVANKEVAEDEDVPEIVTAEDSDILRLKKLHEESTIKPKSKKRKRDVTAKVETPQGLFQPHGRFSSVLTSHLCSADLDMSILDAVEDYEEEKEQRLQQQLLKEMEASLTSADEPKRNQLSRKM